MDEAKRMEYYGQAERILVEDAGGVFIYHTHVAGPAQALVQGPGAQFVGTGSLLGQPDHDDGHLYRKQRRGTGVLNRGCLTRNSALKKLDALTGR